MPSCFLTLSKNDFFKGLVLTALTAMFATLAAAVNVPGFSWASYDWTQLLSVTVTVLSAYLTKNLFTNSKGEFLEGEHSRAIEMEK